MAIDDPAPSPRQISFMGAAGWMIALELGRALVVQLAEAARPGAEGDLVTVTGAYVAVHLLVVFAMLRVYDPEGSIREALGLRVTSWPIPLLAAIAGAAMYPTLSALDTFVMHRFPQGDENEELVSQLLTANGHLGQAFLFAALVVLLPVAEDIFFRGMLFSGIHRGRTRAIAFVATASFATLAHFDARYLGSTMTVAFFVSWLRAESGSIVPAFLAHAAFMAVPAARLLHDPDGDDAMALPVRVATAAIAVVAFALLLVATRRGERAAAARELDDRHASVPTR